MKSFILLVGVFVLAFTAIPAVAGDAPKKNAKPLRVLLTIGGHPFDRKPFFAMWDALPGIQYTTAPLPESVDLLKPGLEKQYDVIVMYDMINHLTPDQERNLTELLKTGIGLVSLHHNLCSHDDWPEYRSLIGGRYFHKPETIDGREYLPSHYLHDQHFEVEIADREHPITKGLSDFHMDDEVYSGFYVAPSSHVLLTVDHPNCDHNVAWVTESGNGRVFYLMFGHGPSAWQNPNYQKLLVRGIRWVARQDPSQNAN